MGRIRDFLTGKVKLTEEQLKELESEVNEFDKELESKVDNPASPPKKEEKEDPEVKPTTTVAPVTTTKDANNENADLLAQFKAVVSEAVAPLQKKVDSLDEDLQSRTKSAQSQKNTELLDKAIASGKIEPGKREDWAKDLEESPDSVARVIDRLPENPALAKEYTSKKETDTSKTGGGTKPTRSSFSSGVDPQILKQIEEDIAAAE